MDVTGNMFNHGRRVTAVNQAALAGMTATAINAASVVSIQGIEVGAFPSVYWKEPFGPTGAHRGDLRVGREPHQHRAAVG